MKTLKIFALILTLSIILLTGCDSSDKSSNDIATNDTDKTISSSSEEEDYSDVSFEDGIKTQEQFIAFAHSILDLSNYEDLRDNSSTGKDLHFEYRLYENLNYDIENKIKLADGTELTLPITAQNIASLGWTFENKPKAKIDAEYVGFTNLQNSQGNIIHAEFYNPTTVEAKYEDCTVCAVEFELYEKGEKNPDTIGFTICDNITEASSIKDIIKKLGNPTTLSCYISHDPSGNYSSTSIYLSYLNDSVGEVSLDLGFHDDDYMYFSRYSIKVK